MKKILLHSPGTSTLNLGDINISNSAKRELSEITENSFVVEVPTHLSKIILLYAVV